ncbi:pyridoxal phosphate-dependent aminotransferase [Paraburkholderia aspalathi]|uniref:Aminotransferase n=1 Tax=Paraburkholderia nemoris TaxID=2793076 RepID=A0ABN7M9G9_9BURK|nr:MULTISPECIES: pyridoxal phosphate-dependent aminotransferase [Paraburkholderia]MBK3812890.1 pyridoxal phosphate-dependent aminotransferase [Paraburkholderia aspalathi]CAE6788233.1 Aspartate/prephenate aminotransferase [Paraburkholderia nemoris]
MPLLAKRLDLIQPSPSVSAMNRAKTLAAAGEDICNMAAGEPDFPTPPHIVEAAARAMRDGATRYTATDGTAALKNAIAAKFERENHLAVTTANISVASGAKQIIYNAFTCTINAGDEVIVPAPYWVSYPDIVKLNGGVPVFVTAPAEQRFKMTQQQLADALTPRTKWLVLNSPNNPSGAIYSEGELRGFAQVLRDHPQVHVMTDDIYEHLIYDGLVHSTFAHVNPDLADRTLTINGVSKTYAMTGFRIGYASGPVELIKAMEKLQSQSTSNPAAVSQAAAVAALNGPLSFFAEWRNAYKMRRDRVVALLHGKAGLDCPTPDGAFYAYVSCATQIGKTTLGGKLIKDDSDFVMYLLDDFKVATVQGAAYGISPAFRISFATSMDVIEKACHRIIHACKALR